MDSQLESAMFMPDMLTMQLQQERDAWKAKYYDKNQEALRLAGVSSKITRLLSEADVQKKKLADLQIANDRIAKLQVDDQARYTFEITHFQVESAKKDEMIEELGVELAEARRLLREAELQHEINGTKTTPPVNHRSTFSELEHVRSQLIDMQQNLSKVQNLHKEFECEKYVNRLKEQIAEADQSQKDAQATTEALRHVMQANELLQEQNVEFQKQLLQAMHDGCKHAADADRLRQTVEMYCAQAKETEEKVSLLEEELDVWETESKGQQEVPQGTKAICVKTNVKLPHERMPSVADHPIIGMFKKHSECAEPASVETYTTPAEAESVDQQHGRTTHSPPKTIQQDRSSGQAVSTISSVGVLEQLSISITQCAVVEPQAPYMRGQASTHVRAVSGEMQTTIGSKDVSKGHKDESLSCSMVPLTGLSPVPGSEPQLLETNYGKAEMNITIHINSTDQKAWTLLQRAQSIISKTSRMDIHGPKDHVNAFVLSLNKAAGDHADQAAAARHWQDVALRSLGEVDSLRTELNHRPLCAVAAHRNLPDELEAKNVQLQIQSALLADWQKKMARARAFFEKANAEMHQQHHDKLVDLSTP